MEQRNSYPQRKGPFQRNVEAGLLANQKGLFANQQMLASSMGIFITMSFWQRIKWLLFGKLPVFPKAAPAPSVASQRELLNAGARDARTRTHAATSMPSAEEIQQARRELARQAQQEAALPTGGA